MPDANGCASPPSMSSKSMYSSPLAHVPLLHHYPDDDVYDSFRSRSHSPKRELDAHPQHPHIIRRSKLCSRSVVVASVAFVVLSSLAISFAWSHKDAQWPLLPDSALSHGFAPAGPPAWHKSNFVVSEPTMKFKGTRETIGISPLYGFRSIAARADNLRPDVKYMSSWIDGGWSKYLKSCLSVSSS